MSAVDQTITCRDCGQTFTFTVSEQEFFASKGFANAPTRCPECRKARKGERDFSGGRGGSGLREPRKMYAAVCSRCGKETEVPFEPRGDKPVYCSECFRTSRIERS